MMPPNPPGLCRLTCYLTAGVFSLSPAPARGEPCETSTVMRPGDVAGCSGILVPGRRSAQCVATEEELAGCRVRLAGEVEARRLAEDGWREEVRLLEAALEVERQAGRDASAPDTGPDWSAFAWGVGAGLVLGALIVGGAVAASR